MITPRFFPVLLLIVAGVGVGCSKDRTSASDSAKTGPANLTPVSGTVTSISDSVLTVSSADGEIRVALTEPLAVYSSVPATLSQVKENSFVGITSVAEPGGAQRATEIHIFPDKLRGTGEGSYLMTQQGGAEGGSRSTMTNGTVTAPRMTNGTISGRAGGTLTVEYQGGTQTITIPANVSVTAIAPVQTKLSAGSKVIVLASKQPDGTLKASAAMLTATTGPAK